MARPGITYLDVAQAATKLHEKNVRPSIEEVRKLLGTGSNSTINRHLRAWRDKQGNQMDLEQGLPESLLIAVKSLYEATQEEADHKISSIKTEADQALIIAQNQLSEIKEANQQLAQDKQSLEVKLCEEQAEKELLTTTLNEFKRQNDKTINDNNLLQQRLDDKNASITQLNQQLKHAQENLEHYRESIRQERASEISRHDSQVARLENDMQQHRELTLELQSKISKLVGQNQLIEQDKETYLQELILLRNQNNISASKLQASNAELKVLQGKYDNLFKENIKLAENSKSDKKCISSLQMKIERVEGLLEGVSAALKKAEDNIASLNNKNLFLVQEGTEFKAQLKQFLSEPVPN